mgnify:CR=1 FL=1
MGVHNIDHVEIRPAVPPDKTVVLGVQFTAQEETNWCWAACAQMAIQLRRTVTMGQCKLATQIFAPNPCCDGPASKPCNKGCTPDQVITAFKNNNIPDCQKSDDMNDQGHPVDQPQFFKTIMDEMDNPRPVEICYSLGGSSFHMVLVTGYYSQNGTTRFMVLDPKGGPVCLDSTRLQTLDGTGIWTISWTNIK